ncbi:hypothetical protein [Flavobacterium gelatinilyticum]|uniref:hypothetical protein n=1 Tax=Flavobacterium gelatinilyticum TaxID=3003260 RepID=UPI0024801701|nr:hypothetical protein [Flavobacterium gelatinilyticum]
MKKLINLISVLIIIFFNSCNSKNKELDKKQSSALVEKKAKENSSIPLKILLSENEFITEMFFETDLINFRIYYLKDKETSYLKVEQFNNYSSVDFCINTSSMEEAKNQFRLFKQDSFYYLMIPTCTEELPTFHVIKFDASNSFNDLGIYTFKYNEKIFSLGKFKEINYSLVNQNNEVVIKGKSSEEDFYLSKITDFKNKTEVTSDDVTLINELSSKNRSSHTQINKFIIDKNNKGDGLFRSNNLDQLFKFKNEIYKQGKSFVNIDKEYHLVIINIMNQELNKIKETYILSFNKDILSDTLKIRTNLVIDCNIIIEKNNNERAFCLRSIKESKLHSVYIFDKKNKIIKMPANTIIRPSNVINLDDRD